VSFHHAESKGDANFAHAVFSGFVYFQKSIFKGYANFDRVEFGAGVEFGGAAFDGYADFSKATFDEYTCFQKARFHGIRTTVTAHATQGESADFVGTIFKGDVDFMGADFLDGGLFRRADFTDSSLEIEEESHIIYDSDTKWPRNWANEFVPPLQWIQRKEDLFSRPGPAVLFYTYSDNSLPSGEPDRSALAKRDERVDLVRRIVSKPLVMVGIPADSEPEEYEERHRLPSPNGYIIRGPSRSSADIAPGPHRNSSLRSEHTERVSENPRTFDAPKGGDGDNLTPDKRPDDP
jgi:hypothetical protein